MVFDCGGGTVQSSPAAISFHSVPGPGGKRHSRFTKPSMGLGEFSLLDEIHFFQFFDGPDLVVVHEKATGSADGPCGAAHIGGPAGSRGPL